MSEDLALLSQQRQTKQTDVLFWIKRLALYTELGELREIGPLVKELADAFPQVPQFLEARMIQLSLEEKTAEAITLGERIQREFPGYPTIRTNLARIYLKAERRAEGVNLMLTAIQHGPVRVEDWDLLLQAMGLGSVDPDKLVQQLQTKVTQNPEVKGLKYALVLVCTRLGRFEEARQLLQSDPALADHPDLAEFMKGVGQVDVGGTP